MPMNDELMESLLHEEESSALDFKRDQYPFVGATNDEKSELLKDCSRSPMRGGVPRRTS